MELNQSNKPNLADNAKNAFNSARSYAGNLFSNAKNRVRSLLNDKDKDEVKNKNLSQMYSRMSGGRRRRRSQKRGRKSRGHKKRASRHHKKRSVRRHPRRHTRI